LDKTTLNYDQILSALRLKREQIEEAILVIEHLARDERGHGRTQPAWVAQKSASQGSVARNRVPKKRTLSAAGRERIASAARKRWAAKRAAETAPTKAASRKIEKATKKQA
jgi:hypothetical protein